MQSLETLDTLEKLVANVSRAPTELKFRKLRLSNPKIAEVVVNAPGALAALQHLGWEVEDDSLTLPISRQLKHAHVRRTTLHARHVILAWCLQGSAIHTPALLFRGLGHQPGHTHHSALRTLQVRVIQDAQERLKKVQKDEARSKAASKATLTKDQQQLRAQMEADRRERALRGPSQGSRAQPLPTGDHSCSLWWCLPAPVQRPNCRDALRMPGAGVTPCEFAGGGLGNTTSLRTLVPEDPPEQEEGPPM